MMLSRWRRVATGLAAGVIVLCAALLGGALRDDSTGVSVAADIRPTDAIPIPEDTETPDEVDAETVTTSEDPADAASDDVETESATTDDTDDAEETDALTEPVRVIEEDAVAAEPAEDATPSESATEPAENDEADTAPAEADAAPADPATDEADDAAADPSPTPPPAQTAPLDSGLGTGGGVDDAECALDRLVIYAGARRGGVAGSIRAALSQAGFGAGCAQPPTILASNCPLQFSGVLGPNASYDPNKSFVASSDAVDRNTMTAVMGQVGYAGNEIDILDFSFVNPDAPGEQWMAIFVPPSFAGWENLANRAGLAPTSVGLCGPSGRVGS